MRGRAAVLALLLGGVACAGSGGPSASSASGGVASCAPVEATLPSGATLADMAGRYRLTMVRGDGEAMGASRDAEPATAGTPARAVGVLTLTPRSVEGGDLNGYAEPLQGFADIDLARVGAYRVGSLDSTDPDAPGVLVLEATGAEPGILLRFGSTANRRDRMAFDEAFTVLEVRRIADGAFAGRWRSGLRAAVVRGYFCAEPAD